MSPCSTATEESGLKSAMADRTSRLVTFLVILGAVLIRRDFGFSRNEAAIRELLPLIHCNHLDRAGYVASMANRCLLRRSMSTSSQIRFWDRVLVRISRLTDPLLFHRVGRSVLVVYEAPRREIAPMTSDPAPALPATRCR